jgi:transcription elongation factor GreA
MTDTVFVSAEKLVQMRAERVRLKESAVPAIAKRIDEAKQLGDLSENAEYHAARDEMAWAQSRIIELDRLLELAQVVEGSSGVNSVGIGTTFTASSKGKQRTFTIVGAQEADPVNGKISNESPTGSAFLGKSVGESVCVTVPAGTLEYTIESIV